MTPILVGKHRWVSDRQINTIAFALPWKMLPIDESLDQLP